MTGGSEKFKEDLVNLLAEKALSRFSGAKAKMVETFIRKLYAGVPPDDLLEKEPDALYGAAVSLLGFIEKKEPGKANIRVYNPRFEEHGWKAGHTVVEIVNDDMPFLVDSVTAQLNRLDLVVHLVIHPVIWANRDAKGVLKSIPVADEDGLDSKRESIMYIEINEQTDAKMLKEIVRRNVRVLEDVRAAVEDWQDMRKTVLSLGKELETPHPAVAEEEQAEVRDFLHWLHENHFTFLGYREYDFSGEEGNLRCAIKKGSALGVLRHMETQVFDGLRNIEEMPEEANLYLRMPHLLLITKGNNRSTVHRPVHFDVVILRKLDPQGEVLSLRLFVGLFTADVYFNSPSFVPVLRRKVQQVVEMAGYKTGRHDGKRLTAILDNLPRDELFQGSVKELQNIATGILHLQERHRVALFIRKDHLQRFVSCLIYIPRDRYDSDLRLKIQHILERDLDARMVAFFTQVIDAPLARVHFIMKLMSEEQSDFETQEIERQLTEVSRSWGDHLHDALMKAHGEEKGLRLYRSYANAFPYGYRETFEIDAAVFDIDHIQEAVKTKRLEMNLYRPIEAPDNLLQLKVYNCCDAVPLSDALPMLENMGLKVMGEMPFEVITDDGKTTVWIHDFGMETARDMKVDLSEVRNAFQDAFLQIWNGMVENDGFNRLVLLAGMPWREVVVLRAYAKFLRQCAFTFSQAYIEDALAANPKVTRLLLDMFNALFDPHVKGGSTTAGKLRTEIIAALDDVMSADEDKILRRYLDLITHTLRTNYFQTDGQGAYHPYMSFKLDSRALEELPLPRPMVEIFVYSPRVEGVHLRGGRVARGGLRWSDRREDFRTEVLGLMKAQMVKNAVIVPVGSKGGFVVKRPPEDPSRDAQLAEGIACYKIFISGLLDITDNLVGGFITPPKDVVRRDVDDPYLVVAADKGTATFSDIANGISLEYGFWLGDAFASGGSVGYDHKVMGITAKGAWESVKRHFREMGVNTQTEPFSTIGVGDMAGDVFGNGMLRSEHIRLVAAFNHMHIFIDPDPQDTASALAERQRLFDKPRSSWSDYNTKLISQGGGVFERSAKKITLTPEIKARFKIKGDEVSPNDLIKAILKVEVDLLWFGGIGTYIKACAETDANAGDRNNDAVRVNGKDIKAKVIGEGANMGVTQRGRIEMALNGVRLNTDAIDNSAGVDCSDHEVNIKILLHDIVESGDMTEKQRNALLVKMTNDVSVKVLRDNYLQTQAITLMESQGMDMLDHQDRLMRTLEKAGRLDRELEFLPNDEDLADRFAAKKGLTRPEISVLIPYSKLWLYDEILESDLPDETLLLEELVKYFPTAIQKKYRDRLGGHRLKRNIIATVITNSMINRVGGTFVTQLAEKTGLKASDVARAYLITRDAFGLRDSWHCIEAVDNKVPTSAQTDMFQETNRLIERSVLWLLRNGPHPLDIGVMAGTLGAGIKVLKEKLPTIISKKTGEMLTRHAKVFTKQGVPEDLAMVISRLILLASSFDIVKIADHRGLPVEAVAQTYFAVGSRFGLGWLRASAERQAEGGHWQHLAVAAVIEELYTHQREIADAVLQGTNGDEKPETLIFKWTQANVGIVERADQLLAELQATGEADLAMLTVASRQYRVMTHG